MTKASTFLSFPKSTKQSTGEPRAPQKGHKMFIYENIIRIKTLVCPECMGKDIKTSHNLEQLPIKEGWEDVMFYKPKIYCNECEVQSDAFESSDAIHDATCVAMGLLPPPEIKSIRKSLGFSSAEKFSKALNIGLSTIKRWECRAEFPTKSSMLLLRSFMELGKEQYAKIKDNITEYEGSKIKQFGNVVQDKDTEEKSTKYVSRNYLFVKTRRGRPRKEIE